MVVCVGSLHQGTRSNDLSRVGFWDVFEVIEPRLPSMVFGSVFLADRHQLLSDPVRPIPPSHTSSPSDAGYRPLFIAELWQELIVATAFSDVISLFYLIILFVVLEFIFSALGDFIIGVGTEGLLRHLRDRLYDGIIACSPSPFSLFPIV